MSILARRTVLLLVLSAACSSTPPTTPPPPPMPCGPDNGFTCPEGQLCYYFNVGQGDIGKCLFPPDHSDMSTPADATIPVVPCVDVGMVPGHYYGCPGLFGGTNAVASVQCAAREPGAAPCTATAGVDFIKAAALTGFFLANQGLTIFADLSNNCNPKQNSMAIDFGWFGLGTPRPEGRNSKSPCNGFTSYESNSSTPGWHSSDFPPGPGVTMALDNVASTRDNDGVLCCR